MPSVKKMTIAAACIALCVVLPILFHVIPDAGTVFLPMHIPVLICGMVCSWPYGVICGVLGPLLSSMLTGMPGAAFLLVMMLECAAYGAVSGLMLKYVCSGWSYPELYASQIVAMLAGRVVSGVAKALIFSPGITFSVWVTTSFVTALPGVVLQLVLVPAMIHALMKAGLISAPVRKEKMIVEKAGCDPVF